MPSFSTSRGPRLISFGSIRIHVNWPTRIPKAKVRWSNSLPSDFGLFPLVFGTDSFIYSHTGVVWGGETGINTYVGHEFEVIELEVSNGKCLMSECRRTTFQVNENEDQGESIMQHTIHIVT